MAAGWPTWLVPVLAVGRALTTHHRPHNCPYKSVALGLFRRGRPPRRVLGGGRRADDYAHWGLAAVSAVTPAHRAAPGQAAGIAGGDLARILLVQDRVPAQRRAAAAGGREGDAERWRSRS